MRKPGTALLWVKPFIFMALVVVPLDAGAWEEMSDFRAEIERELSGFRAEQQKEYREFRDERDRLFSEFLQEQWKEFEEFAALIADQVPKPVKVPRIDQPKDSVAPTGPKIAPPPPALPPVVPAPSPPPRISKPEPESRPLPPTPSPPPPSTPSPPVVQPLPEPGKEPPAVVPGRAFDFYGRKVRVVFDPAMETALTPTPDNQAIASFWKTVSSADFQPTITELLRLRQDLHLNDWGYYQLVSHLVARTQPKANDATLLSWFLLTKSGYRAKVGFSGEVIHLLVPATQTMYGTPFFTLDGTRYYNFSVHQGAEKPGPLFIYKENYPGAERQMGLFLERLPIVPEGSGSRLLSFAYGGKSYQFPVLYNANAIRFLDSYPQTDLPVFFAAAVSPEIEASMLAGLTPILAGKHESEAVNILLRFVQTAFEYQTDEEQFGREKYFFAEETVHFPFSDCEDRSVLFSYLVRRLIGLEVVGLLYPGHVATAVRFTGEVKGDRVTIDGRTFVVCDPTYINADIGMAMPQFKGVKPEVIPVGI